MLKHTITSLTVEIDAPQEFVWEILVDVQRYGEWNPFTYRVDTTLNVGDPVDLYVRMPQRGDRVQQERIQAVDQPVRLSWGVTMGAAFLLKARRDQHLERLSDTRCAYRTLDVLEGLLTPLVSTLFGDDMLNGFNAMALALKQRAELLWSARQAAAGAA